MPASSGNVLREEAFNDIFGLRRALDNADLQKGAAHLFQPPPLDVSSIPALPHPQDHDSDQQPRMVNVPAHLQQRNVPVPQLPTLDPSQRTHQSPLGSSPLRQRPNGAVNGHGQAHPQAYAHGPGQVHGQAHPQAHSQPYGQPQPQKQAQGHFHGQPQGQFHGLQGQPYAQSHGQSHGQQNGQHGPPNAHHPPLNTQPHAQPYPPQLPYPHQAPHQAPVPRQGQPPAQPMAQQRPIQQYRTVSAPHYPQYDHPPQPQYPNSASRRQENGAQLPPLKVNLNTLPELVPERFRNSPTVLHSSQAQSQQQRSPILRQGLGFFNRSGQPLPRSVSTGAVHSELNLPQQGPRTMSLSSHDKYHQQAVKPATLSGRIIPQKVEMTSSSLTLANSTSGNSSPNLTSKSRSFSSIAKGSLSKRKSSSSLNLKTMDRSVSNSSLGSKAIVMASRRPTIYPALLSRVAKSFQESIVVGSRFKNGLEYRDSFTGSELVDVILHIIRTSDRNLLLLLGRALDLQRFFHDVTYEHRLRDTANEVYQFNTITTFYEDPSLPLESRHNSLNSDTVSSPVLNSHGNAGHGAAQVAATQQQQQQTVPVNGVFTLLTECYSPTCTKDRLCYSIACPRRLEQQLRLNLKPQGGLKNDNHLSLQEPDESKHLWSYSVPKEVLDSVDKKELKRQESIFEAIYTERDFVKDLEYMRDFWIRPLRESNIIPEREREKFIRTVFSGITEILLVNAKFAELLTRRQNQKPIVDQISDLFLQYIPHFEPFVYYGAGQVFGKYEYERQKTTNPLFSRFIEETERLKESRRLDISSFLSKPTTRMPKYILLLRTVKHNTNPDSPDYENLDKLIALLQKLLDRINEETGKLLDRHELIVLKQKLQFRPGEYVDLKLSAPNRRLLYKGVLKKRNQDKENQGEVHVYLFDHALVFVRIKVVNKREQHKVYQRPVPLQLLFLSTNEDSTSLRQLTRKPTVTSISSQNFATPSASNANFQKFPLTFLYIGRKGYDLTLYAPNYSTQRSLMEKIEEQHRKLTEQNDIFTLVPLTQKFFDSNNKINCVVPFDGGRRLLYGTDSGIYISNIRRSDRGERVVSVPIKVINKVNIIQLEVLEEYQTFLVLTDKKLMSWSLDILQQTPDSNKNAKLGRELMTHVSFFRVGICSGRMLVCAAKNGSNHLIRVFEPIDPIQQKKLNKKKFKNETKELYFNSEPVSISFLKTKLCVGCTKGFEIVSMETNSMESLLDPLDTSLDFVTNKEGLKPLEIDRINSDFLLSYSDFSFYVNRNGWRSRSNFLITWEGLPQSFAIWYPYLLLFDSNFIEIRHVETGELIKIINGENIRLLHSSSQEILYLYEDERGYDVVASLDFWDKSMLKLSSSSIEEVETK